MKKRCDFVLHRTWSRSTNTHAHTKFWCYLISIFLNAPEATLKTRLEFRFHCFLKWDRTDEGGKCLPKVSASTGVVSKQVFPHGNTDFNLIFFLCTKNNVYDSPKINKATCWILHLFPLIMLARNCHFHPHKHANCLSPPPQPCLLHVLVFSHFPSFTVSLCPYTSSSTSSLFFSPVLLKINQPLIFIFIPEEGFKGLHTFKKHCTCIIKREDPNQMIHTLHFIAIVIHFWPCDKIPICFFLPLISKKTSWRRGMCSWRASHTRSWFGSITLFRPQRSFTLSLTMSMEERYEHEHQGLRWAETLPCMWYKHCNIFLLSPCFSPLLRSYSFICKENDAFLSRERGSTRPR